MTNDTPPKRIWLLPHDGEQRCWCVDPDPAGTGDASDSTEYTLTSEVEAMVAAALQGAAHVDWTAGRNVADTAPEYLNDWQRGLVAGQSAFRDAILALIPQPASTALDKLIAEAVAAERDRVTRIAASLFPGGYDNNRIKIEDRLSEIAAKGDQT